MKLNYDYSDIERQMRVLKGRLENTTDKDEYYQCASVFGTLNYLYYLKNGREFITSDDASIIARKSSLYYQAILDLEKESFLRNKEYHRKVFFDSFFGPSDVFSRFVRTSHFKRMRDSNFQQLREEEGNDLLLSFFKDCFKEGKVILEELKEEGHLYGFADDYDEITSSSGFMTFNRFEGLGNVFLRRELDSVSALATLVHEIGHVYDFLDSSKTFTMEEKSRYALGPYVEVLSIYYQQLFLEYLIKNNIRKEEVRMAYFDLFSGFFSNLDTALLLSLVTDQEYSLIVDGDYTKNDVLDMLNHSSLVQEFEFDEGYPVSVMSGTKEIGYSYGFLLSNMLVDRVISKNSFLRMRSELFKGDDLEEIGFSSELSRKCLVKRMNNFIKK